MDYLNWCTNVYSQVLANHLPFYLHNYFLHDLSQRNGTTIIVPVFKKGTDSNVANYRPISLTCVKSKIVERVKLIAKL